MNNLPYLPGTAQRAHRSRRAFCIYMQYATPGNMLFALSNKVSVQIDRKYYHLIFRSLIQH